MAALDAGLAAARRSQASATRAYYLPSLAVQAEANRLFDESGVGSGPGPLGTSPPDTDWNVGLQASFALLRGGGKRAARGRARAEVARLEVERQAAAERIEQRTRSALHRAGASYAGIREARTAAEQARRSLELVSDAYSRGARSLIDLLDAQNARIVADQAAAEAVYDFLDDFLEVQRAVGRFDFAMTGQERADLETRLRAFARRKGVEPRVR
jgi:outer membrane protein TolC